MNNMIGLWPHKAVIADNNFVYKSLSNWSYNVAVGCEHGCVFCYVPSVSTIKQGKALEAYGITDPDAQWGQYVLLRVWNPDSFRASLKRAEAKRDLKADGNRAVMLCTTTDPYQVVKHPSREVRATLTKQLERLVREALEIILEESTLNVRILTRSPLAKRDFDLFKKFGKRLMFGMSLPTMDAKLAKVYEPMAPAPMRRYETLQAAKDAGLNIYVAMAPTYPECSALDIAFTLSEIKKLEPLTVFHEPINIRAENIARIKANADAEGVALKTEVFATKESWQEYALLQLRQVESCGQSFGLPIHLWPDKSLQHVMPNEWIAKYWNRISEWPV